MAEAKVSPPTAEAIKTELEQKSRLSTMAPFLLAINRHQATHPDVTGKFLNTYLDLLRSTALQDLNAGNPFGSLFHMQSVQNGRPLPAAEWLAYRSNLTSAHESAGFAYTAKFLREESDDSPSNDLYEPMDLEEHFKYLADVTVTMEYRDRETGMDRKYFRASGGSGYILDEHHVLTAFHVLDDQFYTNVLRAPVRVRANGKDYTNGRLTGWDSTHDLAIIEMPQAMEAPTLPHKRFGNSLRLRRGMEVFGLGHPNGLSSSLTRGIISSMERRGFGGGHWIQFDATQAPGSSGGVLVGKDGLIYGVLLAGVDGAALNFAVPSHIILQYLDLMIQGRSIGHGWMGLLLESTYLEPNTVRIGGVLASSPASPQGIDIGSTLVKINQKPVGSIRDAQAIMASCEPGQLVSLTWKGTNVPPPAWGKPATNEAPENTIQFLAQRKPKYPVFWSRIEDLGPQSFYTDFGFSVDHTASNSQFGTYQGKKYPKLRVTRVQAETYLDGMGLRPDDHVMILSDRIEKGDRHLDIYHLPRISPGPLPAPAGPSTRILLSPGETRGEKSEPFLYRLSRSAGDFNGI